jgi:hypothetical protein
MHSNRLIVVCSDALIRTVPAFDAWPVVVQAVSFDEQISSDAGTGASAASTKSLSSSPFVVRKSESDGDAAL